MECQSVDQNSNLISGQGENKIQTFLENVKGPLKVKSNYILNKLGLKRVQVREPTRQKVKVNKKEKDSCLSDSYNENTFTKTKSE